MSDHTPDGRTLSANMAIAAIPLFIALVLLIVLGIIGGQITLAVIALAAIVAAIPAIVVARRFDRRFIALTNANVAIERRAATVQAEHDRVVRRGTSELFSQLTERSALLAAEQLACIRRLEADCTDANTLGGYYQLDRLTTRLHATVGIAHSLDNGAATSAGPQSISDIVTNAVGSVGTSSMIDVAALDSAQISSAVADDLGLTLAALLEAVVGMADNERVRVDGWLRDHDYTVVIAASSIDLTSEDRDRLSTVLSNAPVLGAAPHPLPFSMAAALADRHGIALELLRDATGLAVSVKLPAEALHTPAPGDAEPATRHSTIRPFMMAGGRTTPATYVEPDVQLLRSTRGDGEDDSDNGGGVTDEARPILELLDRPLTPIELAEQLELPLGVVTVLVGDLIVDERVIVHRTGTSTVRASLLEQALNSNATR